MTASGGGKPVSSGVWFLLGHLALVDAPHLGVLPGSSKKEKNKHVDLGVSGKVGGQVWEELEEKVERGI